MIGKRVYNLDGAHNLAEGEYGLWAEDQNTWYACCPGPHDLVANLSRHTVTEHEDGTITVAPSILCSDGAAGHSWHGFLECGVWRVA